MITKPQRKRLADYLHGRVDDGYVSPPYFYIGLVTGNVADDGTINGEISGGGYNRVQVANSKTSFSNADENGIVRNVIDVSFPESTTAWGNVTAIFFTNVATGGTAQYYIPISPARNVQAFTTVYFQGDPTGANGDIQLSVSN